MTAPRLREIIGYGSYRDIVKHLEAIRAEAGEAVPPEDSDPPSDPEPLDPAERIALDDPKKEFITVDTPGGPRDVATADLLSASRQKPSWRRRGAMRFCNASFRPSGQTGKRT
jgi:hypothetical protein